MELKEPSAKYLVRPGYKRTEVGMIPEDWKVRPLPDFASVKTGPFGTLLKAAEYSAGDGVPLVSVGEIREGHLRITDDTPRVPSIVVSRLPQYLLREGDVVFGRKGAVERSALIRQMEAGWFLGSDGISVRPFDELPVYLACQFQGHRVREYLRQWAIGTTMPSLNQEILHSVQIAFPPTQMEQQAIANALGDADALIESLEHLLAKQRLLRQATMQALLTGEQRLPGFEGAWREYPIGEIALPTGTLNATDERLPVLTCSKHLGFVDSLGYFKNQVFSRDTSGYKVIHRGEIGYPANHIEEGSIGLQDLYERALVSPIYVVFSVKEFVNAYFLHRLLKLNRYRSVFEAATCASVDRRGSLRWPAFSEIRVTLPPLAEQTAIATVLSDLDAEIAALEARIAKARQLKQGMMQELLTGRIRLV